MEKDFYDPAYAQSVAAVKRILEKWILDAGFQDAYRQDPEKALAETGLDVDPETIRLLLVPNDEDAKKIVAVGEGKLGREVLPEIYQRYRAFIQEKINSREELRKELCVPDVPRFQAWRARQERRC